MVMATGTGKTRTAVALVDALMRAHWVKRVLFFVDRIALRDQALAAFKEHLPSTPRWPDQHDHAANLLAQAATATETRLNGVGTMRLVHP
jgi:type I site-specific restriction endonuclease